MGTLVFPGWLPKFLSSQNHRKKKVTPFSQAEHSAFSKSSVAPQISRGYTALVSELRQKESYEGVCSHRTRGVRHQHIKRKVLDKLLHFSTPFIFALRCFCGNTTYVLKGSTKLFHLLTFSFVFLLGLGRVGLTSRALIPLKSEQIE